MTYVYLFRLLIYRDLIRYKFVCTTIFIVVELQFIQTTTIHSNIQSRYPSRLTSLQRSISPAVQEAHPV